MSGIIVGDKPCEFNDVIIIIGKCTPPIESEGIMELMTFLKTPDNKKAEFRKRHLVELLSIKEMLAAALSEWRSRCSNDATLELLISYLRECNLNCYADALEQKYYPEAQLISAQKPSHAPQTEDSPRPSDLCNNMENTKLLPPSPNKCMVDRNIRSTSSNEIFTQDRYTCLIKSLAYVCFVVFVIALAFPAFGFLKDIFDLRIKELDTSSESSALQFEQKINNTGHDYASQTSDHFVASYCKQLSVNGSIDYEDQLVDIGSFDSVCLHLHCNASKYWNRIDSLLKSSQVAEITFMGCIPLDWLTLLLMKFTFVEKLTFVEVEEADCDCKQDAVYHSQNKPGTAKKLTLNHLINIEFHNITSCLSILNFFIHNVTMFRLSTIQIANVIAPNSLVQAIRELLKLVRHSLETLNFSGVAWETSPFYKFNYIFPKLHELTYDLVFLNGNVFNVIGTINVTAPNLKHFKSLEGYLPFEENTVILGLKNIEYLQYGVFIPVHLQEFDVKAYADFLPYLRYLELYLQFDNTNDCKIIGENEIQQSINLTLHSYYVI